MAIRTEVENQFGVVNDYWRIDKVELDFKKCKATVKLFGYANREKLAMQEKNIVVGIEKILVGDFYNKIKELEEFKYVEDLL